MLEISFHQEDLEYQPAQGQQSNRYPPTTLVACRLNQQVLYLLSG